MLTLIHVWQSRNVLHWQGSVIFIYIFMYFNIYLFIYLSSYPIFIQDVFYNNKLLKVCSYLCSFRLF